MNEIDLKKFIKLLKKWDCGKGDYTFGDLCELRKYSYQFSDAIQESWQNDEFGDE